MGDVKNTDEELQTLRREKLIRLVGDISEAHYAAGWNDGIEDDLWRMTQGGSRRYGLSDVAAEDVAELRELSAKLGEWLNPEAAGDDFISLDEWRAGFDAREAERAEKERQRQAYVARMPWRLGLCPVHGPTVYVDDQPKSCTRVKGGSFLRGHADAADLQREVDAHNAALALAEKGTR